MLAPVGQMTKLCDVNSGESSDTTDAFLFINSWKENAELNDI